jgi:hypothetical protein
MKTLLQSALAVVALSAAAFGQCPTGPAFPAAIATDANLLLAKNNISTTLSSSMLAGDSVAVVVSSSGWAANMPASVDSEIMFVTAVAGNVLTVSRGCEGTSAAAHAAGRTVANRPTAQSHTAVTAEIKAMQASLGINLGNVPRGAGVNPVTYDFSAQSPPGTLSAGSNTITMTPVPLGVNGTDTHHYLYVAGTGTPEACLINGGSGTAGQTTGSITISCAGSHAAGWTIQSATAGATEACTANSPCNLTIPAGTYNWYGTFWSAGNVTIQGSGIGVTTLRWNRTNGRMFDVQRNNFALRDVKLLQVGTAVVLNIGIHIAGASSGVASAACELADLNTVWVEGFYDGIYLSGSGQSVNLNGVTTTGSTHDGIVALGAQGYWDTVITENSVRNGVTVGACGGGGPCGWSPFISGLQTYNNGGWGLEATTFQIQISGKPSFFNYDYLGGIHITGTLTTGGWISNAWIQYEGVTASWGTNTTARGILIDSGVRSTLLSNLNLYQIEGNCIESAGPATMISSVNEIGGCGTGAVAGSLYSIKLTGDNSTIQNNHATTPYYLSANFLQVLGNEITVNSATLPALYLVTGANSHVEQNLIVNAGAAAAFQCDSPGTLVPAFNPISGTVTNTCTTSGLGLPITNYPRISATGLTLAKTENWIATENGSNNAIAGALLDSNGTAVPLSIGLRVTIILGHTLRAGANTFTLNAGAAKNIKSSWNLANDIATAVAANAIISLMYDGTEWQLQGQ